MEAPTLLGVCCFFLSSKDIAVSALSVTSTPDVIGVNGGSATFRITYALESSENFTEVTLSKLSGKDVFQAPYFVPPSTVNLDGIFHGAYASRGSTDYSHGKTDFTITLSQVTPIDEGQYTVKVKATGGNYKDTKSQLVVDFRPSTPSISGAPTQPVLGGAGPTVLMCTANLGKPQASMVWSRRIGSGAYTDITENVTKTTANNNDGTTNSTSTLTVNLDAADDGVQFRCQVSNRQATLYAETEVLTEIDTIKPTESGEGGDTIKPTGSGEGGETVKPTENGKGGDTVKPTGNGEGGDVVVSALSVTSTPTVIGVNGGNAEFKISYAMESGETFTKVVLKKWDGSYLFEAPYFMPPSTINVDGVLHRDFKSRGSTDYSFGKTNFTITLSQVTPDDEGQYTVIVSIVGKAKSSKSQLVVDYTIKPTESGEGGETIKPTGSREGGDTIKPTGSGEGGDTVKPIGNGKGGVSVGCDDIPNKILLEAAFGVMAMITPF